MSVTRWGMLPDFIGIGHARTGTTWLDSVLRHGADLPANVKETFFFDRYYSKGIDWYAWHFRRARGDRPVGEICPYFNHPGSGAAQRIKLHLPECKIICTLRDPVDRFYSHYRLLRCNAWTRATSFLEAFETFSPDALEVNRYAAHLAQWFELFGRERVLVVFYEDLRRDRQSYLDRICDFGGIRRIDLSRVRLPARASNSYQRAPKNYRLAKRARQLCDFLKDNNCYRTFNLVQGSTFWDYCTGRGETFGPLSPEVDQKVRAFLAPEVEALEKLLGRELSDWRIPPRERACKPTGSGAASENDDAFVASGGK